MKQIKLMIALLLLAAGSVGNAWADHGGHVRFGVMIGPYWGGPWHYPPPAYYYPPYYPQVVVPAPQVYIEQQAAPAAVPPAPAAPVAAAPANYWYYCAAAKGYYPYVRECPGGWQRVAPQPPGQP
ncbi:MAG: hypothetical protein WCI19_12515 [Betaproteobacteria bacterium]|nr:hypothetical protein [Rhodocyclales bacterium]